MLTFIFEKILKGIKLTDEELSFFLDWAKRAEVLVIPPTQNVTINETNITPLESMVLRVVDDYVKSKANIANLSAISNQMGLQIAGEFRTGNGKVPGDGFTGGRFGYPGFTYGGVDYFLAGVDSDILQTGMSLTDGKIYAGGGAVELNEDGIEIPQAGDAILFSDTIDKTYGLLSFSGSEGSPTALKL